MLCPPLISSYKLAAKVQVEPCQNGSSQDCQTLQIVCGSPTPAIAIIRQSIGTFHACIILRLYTRTTVTCGMDLLYSRYHSLGRPSVEMVRLVVPHSPLFLASATSVYPLLFTTTQHYSHPSGIDWSLPHISHLSDPPGDPAMMAQTQAGLHSRQHPRRRPTYLIFGKPIIVTAQYQSLLSNPETGGQLLPMCPASTHVRLKTAWQCPCFSCLVSFHR